LRITTFIITRIRFVYVYLHQRMYISSERNLTLLEHKGDVRQDSFRVSVNGHRRLKSVACEQHFR